MTTITYRDGVLACDSRATRHDVIVGSARKVFPAADKDGKPLLIAFTGMTGYQDTVRIWLTNGAQHHDIPKLEDTAALLFDKDGFAGLLGDERNFVTRENYKEQDYFAWGSGWHHAITAMDCGSDALRAIEAAALRDPMTAGPFLAYPLEFLDAEDYAFSDFEDQKFPFRGSFRYPVNF